MSCFFAFSGNAVLGIALFPALKILVTLYAAALFMQSGFDKVLDWSGNRSYINGMFEKTILRPILPLLMPTITVLEVGAGLFSLVGAILLLIGSSETVAIIGLLLGEISILLLFTGLRLAKDYGGAAAITAYFIFFSFALALFCL
jgi:uncharacterized membrane protein YphA (DoxX/SURF4 family)